MYNYQLLEILRLFSFPPIYYLQSGVVARLSFSCISITNVEDLILSILGIQLEDQNVGLTTRSKVQGTCNLSLHGFVFPLHDLIPLNGQRRLEDNAL